jgi:anionic cell wall polymer biosynthesis LytR-Cps2A-Psr (LCP) family protein
MESTRNHMFGRLARMLIGASVVMALLVAAGGTFGYAKYRSAANTSTDSCFPWHQGCSGIPPPPAIQAAVGPCVKDVCNYMLLGSDSRTGLSQQQLEQFGTNAQSGAGKNADTIMLVHIDPNLKKAIVLSFPRDLWVNIPGVGYGKINSSFQGGPRLVAATLHALTGLTINHYLYVNLAGFEGVVDTLGGVQMCVPAEDVNTPGWVEQTSSAPGGVTPVYYSEVGHIVDPNTGLDVKPGCQTLNGQQALAFVRTRHLKCDSASPDFYRITRQQQFLRAVLNRILQPQELAQAPNLVGPILDNLIRDKQLDPADLAYLVGQLRGISTGAAEFRAVPGTRYLVNGQDAIKMDPSAELIFKAIRDGKPIGNLGTQLLNTPPSPANIQVTVVDHSSGGGAAHVEETLTTSGFDISAGIVPFATFGSRVSGNMIAYAPGNSVQAAVVKQYFPNLDVKEVKGLKGGIAIFVTSSYKPAPLSTGPPPACVNPTG